MPFKLRTCPESDLDHVLPRILFLHQQLVSPGYGQWLTLEQENDRLRKPKLST